MQKEKENGYLPWLILTVVCIAIFGPNYTQYQLSPLAPQIIETLGLSSGEFTSIFSAPMIPAIFLSLVAGLLVDKFGAKRVIAIGLVITALGTCWRIWSNSYATLFTSMLLTGVAACFLNANSAKIIGSWFPPEKVSSMMGIVLAVSTLAMTVGTGTTAMLPSITVAYTIAAVIAVSSLVLWLLIARDPEPMAGQDTDAPQVKILSSLKVVVKSRGVWIAGLCLLFNMGCNVIISSFLPTALGQRGISSVAAGGYAAAVTIGNLVGCLFAPILVAKLRKAKLSIALMAAIGAVGASFGWTAPEGVLLGICLFVTGLVMGGIMPLLMSTPIQLPEIGPTFAGTAGGFTGTLQLIGAVVIPTYIAAPIAGDNMGMFFIVGGACMCLLFVCALFLPNVRTDSKEDG